MVTRSYILLEGHRQAYEMMDLKRCLMACEGVGEQKAAPTQCSHAPLCFVFIYKDMARLCEESLRLRPLYVGALS